MWSRWLGIDRIFRSNTIFASMLNDPHKFLSTFNFFVFHSNNMNILLSILHNTQLFSFVQEIENFPTINFVKRDFNFETVERWLN